jgi:hypothetical protein
LGALSYPLGIAGELTSPAATDSMTGYRAGVRFTEEVRSRGSTVSIGKLLGTSVYSRRRKV